MKNKQLLKEYILESCKEAIKQRRNFQKIKFYSLPHRKFIDKRKKILKSLKKMLSDFCHPIPLKIMNLNFFDY